MKRSLFTTVLACAALSACGTLHLPRTQGEVEALSTYVPIDPLPVDSEIHGCPTVMSALPDQASRVAIRTLSAGGNVGPILRSEVKHYQVILDYVSSDSIPVRFRLTQLGTAAHGEPAEASGASTAPLIERVVDDTERASADDVVIPVYVGVGIRLTADVFSRTANLDLSSLGALAVAAHAGDISGSMTAQVIGLNSDKITTLLPLPNTINETTIENTILAMGAIKAVLPDLRTDRYATTPRLLAFYNATDNYNPALVRSIVSQLASHPNTWIRRCNAVPATSTLEQRH